MFNILFASSHYLLYWPSVHLRPGLITSVFNALLPSTVFAMHFRMNNELPGTYTHPYTLIWAPCHKGTREWMCIPHTNHRTTRNSEISFNVHPLYPLAKSLVPIGYKSRPHSFSGYAPPTNSNLCHPSPIP
jgi:hypothetical protein